VLPSGVRNESSLLAVAGPHYILFVATSSKGGQVSVYAQSTCRTMENVPTSGRYGGGELQSLVTAKR